MSSAPIPVKHPLPNRKGTVEDMLAQIGDPKTSYAMAPFGMMALANHMALTKVLKTQPARWQDFFFPEAADLPGN